MATEPTCPDCGAELTQDAPAGLCPRCLLRAALAGQAAPSAADETALAAGAGRATADAPATGGPDRAGDDRRTAHPDAPRHPDRRGAVARRHPDRRGAGAR